MFGRDRWRRIVYRCVADRKQGGKFLESEVVRFYDHDWKYGMFRNYRVTRSTNKKAASGGGLLTNEAAARLTVNFAILYLKPELYTAGTLASSRKGTRNDDFYGENRAADAIAASYCG